MNVYTHYNSPIGVITLQANDQGLLGAWFTIQTTQPAQLGREQDEHPILTKAVSQLEQYFSGSLQKFTIPIAAKGTPFQQKVWAALTTIPYGQTCSYQDLAQAIDNPKAVRAVGLANGKNPVSVIIPCHRVIGKNGKLSGYAGGVERKRDLLKFEGVIMK
jgi:methylated-DNA-[protein]-cysteine S-methyltransferase